MKVRKKAQIEDKQVFLLLWPMARVLFVVKHSQGWKNIQNETVCHFFQGSVFHNVWKGAKDHGNHFLKGGDPKQNWKMPRSSAHDKVGCCLFEIRAWSTDANL